MGNLQINTTQNVNLDYKIVGIGERIVSFLIDGLILYMYAILVNLIGDAISYVYEDTWTQRGLIALIFLPAMFYSLLMHSIFNGRTVGKMLLKMRVVRVDGTPVHWSNYLVRWMLRLVDIWIFLGSIGILSILFSEKRQRVGDAAAGTVVISTKNKTKVSHTILEEVEEQYQPQFTNVTVLTDKDVRLIKETYLIAKKSSDFKTLKALRVKVESILNTNSELYDAPYLDTVLKDYNFYTQKM
ncbi:RDD family protein [Flagellimonas meridianipacifica]|uniref:Putative RDD family membrane protein YckC n=1 Tax=Flagellimonas meridianipacifica TaxID=1080225 RepID=A0A2T0MDB1_9FLAO|nr:RDD family protein [Allomuricauda pacifica]PRX55488.1 putative RDD family membrane protein YckC [Allomuricauda pacifica]